MPLGIETLYIVEQLQHQKSQHTADGKSPPFFGKDKQTKPAAKCRREDKSDADDLKIIAEIQLKKGGTAAPFDPHIIL